MEVNSQATLQLICYGNEWFGKHLLVVLLNYLGNGECDLRVRLEEVRFAVTYTGTWPGQRRVVCRGSLPEHPWSLRCHSAGHTAPTLRWCRWIWPWVHSHVEHSWWLCKTEGDHRRTRRLKHKWYHSHTGWGWLNPPGNKKAVVTNFVL